MQIWSRDPRNSEATNPSNLAGLEAEEEVFDERREEVARRRQVPAVFVCVRESDRESEGEWRPGAEEVGEGRGAVAGGKRIADRRRDLHRPQRPCQEEDSQGTHIRQSYGTYKTVKANMRQSYGTCKTSVDIYDSQMAHMRQSRHI